MTAATKTAVGVGGQAHPGGSSTPATPAALPAAQYPAPCTEDGCTNLTLVTAAERGHRKPCDEHCQAPVRVTRGTTNRNVRGSSYSRRTRKTRLIQTYRADVDVAPPGSDSFIKPLGEGIPACRCYRCGLLLTNETLTVDRIIPGAKGGTYKKENTRPACGRCNSSTGAALGNSRRAAGR